MTLGYDWNAVEERLRRMARRHPELCVTPAQRLLAVVDTLRKDPRFTLVERGVSHCSVRLGVPESADFLLLSWSEAHGYQLYRWSTEEVWSVTDGASLPSRLLDHLEVLADAHVRRRTTR